MNARGLQGRMLGAYRLVEQTGQGGMAIVFKAYDESLNRYVAVKILPDYLGQDASFSSRFRAEARNVARLRHPHILPIYGYGEEDGISYFVTDLVEGGTLQDLMGSLIPLDRALHLLDRTADALQYAHDQGVVHRDVKPSNILMLRPDWPLLADFGIARVLEQSTHLTHTGSAFFGTPHYMAPEQARGEPVSPQTDQYALGIILYEMLTATKPFSADTPQALMYQHVYADPPPARERNATLSAAMESTIARALAKRAEDRFPDMRAFVATAWQAAASQPEAAALARTPVESAALPLGGTLTSAQATSASVRDALGSSTERIAVSTVPVATVNSPDLPTSDGRRISLHLHRRAVLGMAGLLLALVVVAVFAFHSLGSAAAPAIAVTFRAPSDVSARFTVLDAGGHRVRITTVVNSGTTVELVPGRYSLVPDGISPFLDPLPVDVRSAGPRTFTLGKEYGQFQFRPVAGRVIVPDFNVQDSSRRGPTYSVAGNQAANGAYLRPGSYAIGFYENDYPARLTFAVAAGATTVVDLAQRLGFLQVLPLQHALTSGFNVYLGNATTVMAHVTADEGRSGAFLPAGDLQLNFDTSGVYLDRISAALRPGSSTTIDLNHVLGTVEVPAASAGSAVTYAWRDRSGQHSIAASSRKQTVFLLAGTYRIELLGESISRTIVITPRPGRVTRLPRL